MRTPATLASGKRTSNTLPARISLGDKGFRPFFWLAAVFAAAIVPLWLLILTGHAALDSNFAPQAWHAHEMLFGYTAAVIAGFLLTAVSNWTERETLVGVPLFALALLWLLGRVLLLDKTLAPPVISASVDVMFLPALAFAIARPLIAAGNTRNLVMIGLLLTLATANAVTHLDALGALPGFAGRATFAALNVVALLMLLISGRIVPMFTRNFLHDESVRSSKRLDQLSLVAMACVLVSELLSAARTAASFSLAAGLLILIRTRHWGTFRIFKEPMLWILHGGHAWIAVSLLLKPLALVAPALSSSSTHALTAGAIGWLSMGMMARVSLGHTGRSITTSHTTLLSFALLAAATLTRVFAPLSPSNYQVLLLVSGSAWTLAFAIFSWAFTPIWWRPRIDGKAG